MNATECYCKIGSEFYPEDRKKINYGTMNYNEAFVILVILIKIIMDYLTNLSHI